MYEYIYTYKYIRVYLYIHVHVYMYIHLYVHIYIQIHTGARIVRSAAYIYMYTGIHTHIHVYTYTRSYTYVHILTQAHEKKGRLHILMRVDGDSWDRLGGWGSGPTHQIKRQWQPLVAGEVAGICVSCRQQTQCWRLHHEVCRISHELRLHISRCCRGSVACGAHM